MEAVVSNKVFSFSDLVGSNSFTDIFFWVEDESLNFMKETFVIGGIFYISYAFCYFSSDFGGFLVALSNSVFD